MLIQRKWAMPNSQTFSIKPINSLIERYIGGVVIDPFARNSVFNGRCLFTNDIDPESVTTHHMDALDFLKTIEDGLCDLVLFDPPYSPRQVSECYKKFDMSVNMETTQSSFWGKLKLEISRVVKKGGAVITCGWNSGGIGKSLGFQICEILLVAHGGWHNDTIVTVERKRVL